LAGKEFLSAFNAQYYSFSPIDSAQIEDDVTRTLARAVAYPLVLSIRSCSLAYDAIPNRELASILSRFQVAALSGPVYEAPLGVPMQRHASGGSRLDHSGDLAVDDFYRDTDGFWKMKSYRRR